MRIEQGPIPLGVLRNRLEKFHKATFKIDAMISNPGGESWPQRLRLDNITDPESWLNTTVNVGNITASLTATTQPIIERRRKAIRFEIEDRISQAGEYSRRIAELAESGIYGAKTEGILARTEESLRILREDEELQVSQYETRDDAFLRGVAQFIQDHPGHYTVRDLERATGRSSGLLQTKLLEDIVGDLGIELRRGRGRRNRFDKEEFSRLAIRIGPPNPRISDPGEKEWERRQGVVERRDNEEMEPRQKIQGYLDANPQYFYSSHDLYRALGRHASLDAEKLEEIMRSHGIVPGDQRTHRYRIPKDKFMEIALDIGFPNTAISQRSKNEHLGSTRRNGSETDEEKISVVDRERITRELGIDLTRVVISPLTTTHGIDTFSRLPRNAKELLERFLPEGIDLQDVTKAGSTVELNKFAVNLISTIFEELWDIDERQFIREGRIISVKEAQILRDCEALRQKQYTKAAVIRTIYNHFSVPIPEAYQKTNAPSSIELNPSYAGNRQQRKGSRATSWDRLGKDGKKPRKTHIPPRVNLHARPIMGEHINNPF